MCGIAGISFNTDVSYSKTVGLEVFKHLLSENTERGKDSTGLCYLDTEEYQIMRGFLPGVSAKNLVVCDEETTGIIGHTRHATVGDKSDRLNVHPFVTDKYIGVHNGTIFNHSVIKNEGKVTADGDTDSELIYRMMDADGYSAFKKLEGTYMLAYSRLDSVNTIEVITNGSKPMVFIKVHGKFVAFGSIAEKTIASWKSFFDKTNVKYTIETIKPCTMYRIRNGKIISRKDMSKYMEYMSEEEGELRYKIDYKHIKAEEYGRVIPVARRLSAGAVKITPSVQGTLFDNKDLYKNSGRVNSSTYANEVISYNAANKTWLENIATLVERFFFSNMVMFQQDDNVYVDIDTLSMNLRFTTAADARKHILDSMFDKQNAIGYPMFNFRKCPDNESTAIYVANILSDVLLHTILAQGKHVIFVKSAHIYTKSVEDYLASILLNMQNSKHRDSLAQFIKQTFINTGHISGEFLVFDDASRKETFLNSKHFSMYKKSPFVNKHVGEDLISRPVYTMDGVSKMIPRSSSATMYDFAIMANAYFLMVTINGMAEQLSCSPYSKRVVHVNEGDGYSSVRRVVEDLNSEFLSGNTGYVTEFINNAKDSISSKGFCNELFSPLRAAEAANKEELESIFGAIPRLSYTISPLVTTSFFANKYFTPCSDGVLDAITTMLTRVYYINRYVVHNTKKTQNPIIKPAQLTGRFK